MDKIEETVYEQAIIVALLTDEDEIAGCAASFAELERLIETAGGSVFAHMTQSLKSPDVRTCIGSGKAQELKSVCEGNDIHLVVFDRDLSPSQIRNLEEILGDVRVIDRSMLILDIFALHARSLEGKLQVELAQLKYTIPRLSGSGNQLSRLGGGIGTRGPGESKLEEDRRHVKRQIFALQKQIDEIEKNRLTQRKQRERSGLFQVAIAGYTNAGKSTLLNALTGAGILAEDKLFATLDPTTRKYQLPDGEEILLTDTVGFIRNLPHHLISAFRSTLEEVTWADMLLVIIDSSDPECQTQLAVTEQLIGELGAGDKPVLYVMNKTDLPQTVYLPERSEDNVVMISAKTGKGMEHFGEKLSEMVHAGKIQTAYFFPYHAQNKLNILRDSTVIDMIEYEDEGVRVSARCDEKMRGMLKEYICD